MDKDQISKPADDAHRVAGPSAAEESLSEALNGLEQILEHRQHAPVIDQGLDQEIDQAIDQGLDQGIDQGAGQEPPPAPDDAQYTIPLLHDVVVPGTDLPEMPVPDQGRGEPPAADIEETEAYRKLAERLANEIEVIVQARVEAAVQKAAEDIREQVRNHLEIMLPEIIEDLKVLGRGPNG
jgi:hypothetical protein